MKKATVPKNTLPVLYVFPDKANGCNVGRQRTRRKCGQQPSRNAVHTGVELLSNNVCNQSIVSPYYFSMSLTVFTSPSLNTSGDLRAFPKAN